jgi:ubiquinone/menaquinone biosynthesis C-methylase UbiE
MATGDEVPVEERIFQVLHHLGISKAHFAARGAADWSGLAMAHPEVISSLTLVCPLGFDPKVVAAVAPRLLVFNGDQGSTADMVQRNLADLPDATIITLSGYSTPNTYADVAVERKEEIGSGMLEFLERMDQTDEAASESPTEVPTRGDGDVANIIYRVEGSGPPLVLLPLNAAPSQWDRILSRLRQAYTTIILGGAELGMVANLEARGRTPGYLGALRSLMQAAQLRPGEAVLDVGCGTGVLDRWLARRTRNRNRIVGVDVSTFLLREAAALAKKAGLENVIEFQEGSAEALPFPDGSFDVTMSSTVIQRVNADQMLAEMVRVTKPGGRVAVVGHAHDMPRWVNLRLRPELKSKVESPPWTNDTGHELGCDDATLYRRFRRSGLSGIIMFPHMSTFTEGSRLEVLQTTILPTLSPEEAEEWEAAVTQAREEGTFFISTPFHCAVGTKP